MKISISIFTLMVLAILIFTKGETIYTVKVTQNSGQIDTLLLSEDQWENRRFNKEYFTTPDEWINHENDIPLTRVYSYQVIDTTTY